MEISCNVYLSQDPPVVWLQWVRMVKEITEPVVLMLIPAIFLYGICDILSGLPVCLIVFIEEILERNVRMCLMHLTDRESAVCAPQLIYTHTQ